ncbi:MAG: linear amide C-N hydrolase [Bacteroidales bacterium]|nr:linear amide C-N hydrolase [Bacteroidales bacterium]
MKKALKITFFSLLTLIVLVGILVWTAFGEMIKGALSVKKLDDNLYYMEYEGDDGFDEFLSSGGAKDAEDLNKQLSKFLSKGYYTPPSNPDTMKFGCSALSIRTPDNDVIMGRNFDYPSGTAVILHSLPKNGYENISTFDVTLYGFGENFLPEGFKNQYLTLSGLFVALDGINEKGFAIADLMAGDYVETHQNTGKPALTTTAAIAYLLKRAATVDEAINLLSGIDMHSDIGAAHHYAMSDTTGKSVVVEYVNNQMIVTESHVVANHYLCQQKLNAGWVEGDNRYQKLCNFYDNANGVMDSLKLKEAIFSVTQSSPSYGTQWTMIMNLSKKSVTYYMRRNFDKPFSFEMQRR